MTDPRPTRITGSCLCGGVSFEVSGKMCNLVACHCSQCRKTSGHFTVASSAPDEAIRFVSDASLTWYRSSPKAQRGFCRVCGGNLFWRPDGEGRNSIFAGVLDNPTGLAVKLHIYCQDKSDFTILPADIECLAQE